MLRVSAPQAAHRGCTKAVMRRGSTHLPEKYVVAGCGGVLD